MNFQTCIHVLYPFSCSRIQCIIFYLIYLFYFYAIVMHCIESSWFAHICILLIQFQQYIFHTTSGRKISVLFILQIFRLDLSVSIKKSSTGIFFHHFKMMISNLLFRQPEEGVRLKVIIKVIFPHQSHSHSVHIQ